MEASSITVGQELRYNAGFGPWNVQGIVRVTEAKANHSVIKVQIISMSKDRGEKEFYKPGKVIDAVASELFPK